MTNSQNPEPVESAAGWVRAPEFPSRGEYLLIGLICLALVVGVFVVAHGKSAAATPSGLGGSRPVPSNMGQWQPFRATGPDGDRICNCRPGLCLC